VREVRVNVRILLPELVYKVRVWLVLKYRKIRYGYAFRRIPLTQGQYAIVDPQDYVSLNQYKWYACKNSNTFYALRNGPRREDGKRRAIHMHRVVLPVPEEMVVDHINHNGLDNRRANLRAATIAENRRNWRKRRKGMYTSRYKGVWWNKSSKKWVSTLGVDGVKKYLGRFEDEIEAAKVYDEAARKYQGEFAEPNF